MFSKLVQKNLLPPDQSEWLIKFDEIIKLNQNYQESDLEQLIEDIAKEAYLKGYKEILDLFQKIKLNI